MTLNPSKYSLGNSETNLRGMIYEEEGIHPDPVITASTRLQHPTKHPKKAYKLLIHNSIKRRLHSKFCQSISNAESIDRSWHLF